MMNRSRVGGWGLGVRRAMSGEAEETKDARADGWS